jgi:hypothetical protein
MAERLECPDCGGYISTAVGMGWQDDDNQVHPWVGTCVRCGVRAGQATTYGLDSLGRLIAVEGFRLDGR